MRRSLVLIPLAFLVAGADSIAAQTLPKSATNRNSSHEVHAPSCAQILPLSSSDWIVQQAASDNAGDAKRRAIATYGHCYDARTDALAAKLAKSGKGPSRSALAEFRDFEAALKAFTATSLAESDPPGDALKTSYASLYEKQFRYAFYQGYEPRPAASTPSASSAAKSAPKSAQAQSATTSPAKPPAETDPLTAAKNHFGELLDALPEEKMHELHAAFAKVLGPRATTNETRLTVYRYAIFLLEPPSAKPLSPPPF
jgi:hypothetical protein